MEERRPGSAQRRRRSSFIPARRWRRLRARCDRRRGSRRRHAVLDAFRASAIDNLAGRRPNWARSRPRRHCQRLERPVFNRRRATRRPPVVAQAPSSLRVSGCTRPRSLNTDVADPPSEAARYFLRRRSACSETAPARPHMPGLLIIAHAPLASSLKAVAEHAYPGLRAPARRPRRPPDMPVEEVEAQARQMLGAGHAGAPDLHRRLRRHAVQHRPASRRRRADQGRHGRERADALAHPLLLDESLDPVSRGRYRARPRASCRWRPRGPRTRRSSAAMIKATVRINNKLGCTRARRPS